jgi:hypothetical protein
LSLRDAGLPLAAWQFDKQLEPLRVSKGREGKKLFTVDSLEALKLSGKVKGGSIDFLNEKGFFRRLLLHEVLFNK